MKQTITILCVSLFQSMFCLAQSTDFDCTEDTPIATKYIVGSKHYSQDIGKGITLLTSYADNGCVDAQLKLGELYHKQQYLPLDAPKAIHYTQLAYEQGNQKAAQLLYKLCKKYGDCTITASEKVALYIATLSHLPCEKKTRKAYEFVRGTQLVAADVDLGVATLNTYAQGGCQEAQYILGNIYKKGFKENIAIDYAKAYTYFTMAAAQGNTRALAHLGQLHERGQGCELNYTKAFEYFEQCYQLGDPMGAYCIGYDYMKGMGSITQNYDLAIEWFQKGIDYPMAKHWLGALNYVGFGTPMNRDAGIEFLVNNENILNSPTLLAHLEAHKNDTQTILGESSSATIIEQTEEINHVLTADSETTEENDDSTTTITVQNLTGNWKGKLVDLDWSGKIITRDFPVTLHMEEDKDTGGVAYTATIGDNSSAGTGILLDNNLYFDNLNITVPKLFRENEVVDLELSLLNANLELKKLNHLEYLTAFVDSNIRNWNEPGRPKLLVLTNTAVTTDNGMEISDELINALLDSQDNSFITLYPNPFETDLLIQYEVEQESFITVEMYSLDAVFYKKFVDNEKQAAGKKVYYQDGTNLAHGVYVVKVTTNNTAYTKLIIKE